MKAGMYLLVNVLLPAMCFCFILGILLPSGNHAVSQSDANDTGEYRQIPDRFTRENSSEAGNVFVFYMILSGIAVLVIMTILIRHFIKRLRERETQIAVQSDQLNHLSVSRSEVEKRYLNLFHRINDGVVVCDLSADGEFSFIRELNKQASLILGRTEDRLKSIKIRDIFEESEKTRMPDLVKQLQMRRDHLFQTRVVTEDGGIRDVEIHASLADANGGWKVIAVIRDISGRISREEKYKSRMQELERSFAGRTRELEDANKEVNLLAGTVSHDLQAPLRTVQESLLRIRRQNPVNDPDFEKEISSSINQIDKISGLIKGILEYSRLGRNELELISLGLSRICSEVLLQLDGLIRTEDADVIIERPMPRVIAHSTTLFRVIQNLVSNGIKYIKPGVKPKVILRAESRNDTVRLWVIDNGIGIAPEYHEKIFNVFERLHGSEEYSGIGLGLAIVKRGIQRMNGSMGLISEVGEGSRFWIELPASSDKEHTAFY